MKTELESRLARQLEETKEEKIKSRERNGHAHKCIKKMIP